MGRPPGRAAGAGSPSLQCRVTAEVFQRYNREKESPCAVGVQKGLLCTAAFTFFSVLSLSFAPLPLSLPHSSDGSGSSKDTLVDSRKSGCCRSVRNLVGVSVWVEPAGGTEVCFTLISHGSRLLIGTPHHFVLFLLPLVSLE